MFGRIKSLFQPKATISNPYEQFVMAFVDECRRQGHKPREYDHQNRAFVVEDRVGREVTVHVENGFRQWLGDDERRRADQLARFVRGVFEAASTSDIMPPLGELMPGVRSRTLISNALLQSRDSSPTQDDAEIAWAPICGELVAMVNHDRPDTLHPLTRRVLGSGKLSFAAAMKHAMANLRDRVPAPQFTQPGPPGLFFCNNLEDFQSSLLLLIPDVDFRFPTLAGDPVALVPSRNQFFVTGSDDPLGLDALVALSDTAHELPHFLSTGLFVWRDGRWSSFILPAGTEQAAKHRVIVLETAATDYHGQKALLDQKHAAQGAAVVALEFMMFQPQPGSEFSATLVDSQSPEVLLPKTDRIRFVDANQAQETLDVTWADAMAIAGALFEPVAGLYPERVRMRGYPTPEMWAELKKKSSA